MSNLKFDGNFTGSPTDYQQLVIRTMYSSMSSQEHLCQMKLPDMWDNHSYKDLLISYLREEETRLTEGVNKKDCKVSGNGKGTKGSGTSSWNVILDENENALMIPMKYDEVSDVVEFNDEPLCLNPMLLNIQQEIETEDRRVKELEEDGSLSEREDDY